MIDNKSEANKRWLFFTINLSIFIFALLTINQYATQYIAKSFGYHPQLGKTIAGNWYSPFAWIEWSGKLWLSHPQFIKEFYLKLTLAFGFVFVLFFLVSIVYGRRARSYDTSHGSARWANKKDIDKMQLLNQSQGVYIGAWKDKRNKIKYLRHNGPEHVLAFAPTRSGKGVGLVLPTLLSWEQSCVVLDIKGENWELTSGYRTEMGNSCLKFDPVALDGNSVKFNPIEEIRMGTEYEVGDVQNLATMIVDPDGKGLQDYWAKAGFAMLTAFILHTLYKSKKEGTSPTLASIYEVVNDPNLSIKKVLEEMLDFEHYTKDDENHKKFGTLTHPNVAIGAREALNKADAELSGVIGTVSSNLALYADPLIKNNLTRSDFKINDLMNFDTPVSLYLVVKPSDMDRLKPLIRIVVNQILRILIKDMVFVDGEAVIQYKYRLLLMLDEFTSIGKLPIFENALAYMAGYGIKSYIIIQDLSQLYGAYTKDEAIVSNCHIRIAYAPNKVETAELLSKMAGTTTIVKTKRSMSGSRSSLALGNVNESYEEQQRPLLTIDECMQLPGAKKTSDGKVKEPGDMLIFVAGNPPIYGKQILYFLDPIFSLRAKVKVTKIEKLKRYEIDTTIAESTQINYYKEPTKRDNKVGV